MSSEKDFKKMQYIGKGAYGTVYLVQKSNGEDANRVYAMKVQEKAKIVTQNQAQRAKHELELLKLVRGMPFLVNLHYAFQTKNTLNLVMDFVECGDLSNYIRNGIRFNEDEARIIIGEIVLGLEQLHKLQIMYRDLKPKNILVSAQGHIKLSDFGLSKRCLNNRTYSRSGTIHYAAPEIFRHSGYTMSVDWWSMGAVMLRLLTGCTPYPNRKNDGNVYVDGKIVHLVIDIPENLSSACQSFLTHLLQRNPIKRLGNGPRDAEEIKEHDFFKVDRSLFNWSDLSRCNLRSPIKPDFEASAQNKVPCEEFTGIDCVEFKGYEFQRPTIKANFNMRYFICEEQDPIDEGISSSCYECRCRVTNELYAVKIVPDCVDSEREANLLQACQGNDHIVKLVNVIRENGQLFIVMERLNGGELLARHRHFSEKRAFKILIQLASALHYMHARGVVHGDIKPENLVFHHRDDIEQIKIIDFGSAKRKYTMENLEQVTHTPQYAAPEVLAGEDYNESSDMWSLGVVLYLMLSGEAAFKQYDLSFWERIFCHKFNPFEELRSKVSEQALLILIDLLQVRPDNRLTAKQLVNHPWLSELIEDHDDEDDHEDESKVENEIEDAKAGFPRASLTVKTKARFKTKMNPRTRMRTKMNPRTKMRIVRTMRMEIGNSVSARIME